jgi:hypothetical protein
MDVKQMLTEAITALKQLIKQADEPVLNTATLADGTIIKYPGELATETAITVVTAEGEIPAPDGDHTLEDGTIVRTKDGKVTEIVAVQSVQQVEVSEERLASLEDKINKIGEMLIGIMEGMDYEMKKKDEVMQSLQSDVATLKAKPAARPAVEVTEPLDHVQKEVERIRSIQNKTRK